MVLWKVALLVCIGFILGSVWGKFCDWFWGFSTIRFLPEALGGILIGLTISLRTRRWWLSKEVKDAKGN